MLTMATMILTPCFGYQYMPLSINALLYMLIYCGNYSFECPDLICAFKCSIVKLTQDVWVFALNSLFLNKKKKEKIQETKNE